VITVIETLLALPVLAKVLGTLALILALNAAMRQLLGAILCGTLLLGFWVGHGPAAIARIAWERLYSLDNLLLMASFFLIIWLSSLMAAAGVMEDLVATVAARVPYRTAFAALPAVIGLLPMPGGAVFSAPMVDRVDRDGTLPAWLKTQTNYWFRHVWEYWWPLYPGVLLALDLTGLETWRFLVVQLPLSALAILAGYLFFLRRIPKRVTPVPGSVPAALDSAAPPAVKPFWGLVAPILAVIGVYLALQLAAPTLTRVSRYLPILIGLVLALAVLQAQRRPGLSSWRRTVLSGRALQMAVLIAAIRVYGAVIEARLPGGILLVEQMRGELTGLGIPAELFIVLIPLVTGLALGLNVGTIGASFPVVLSLLGPSPALAPLLSATVLAYACGYAGQLLSPVHICLVVTSEYFRTSLLRNLGRLLPPIVVLLAGAYGFSRLLGALGGLAIVGTP